MWHLYSLAKLGKKQPSEIVGITDLWIAYQFNSAIGLVGTTIENALNEMVKGGSDNLVNRYELSDLLKPEFKLPRPLNDKEKQIKSIEWFKSQIGKGVKWFKAKPKSSDSINNEKE